MAAADPQIPTPAPEARKTTESVSTGVLVAVTAVVLYLCYLVALPFFPAIAWPSRSPSSPLLSSAAWSSASSPPPSVPAYPSR